MVIAQLAAALVVGAVTASPAQALTTDLSLKVVSSQSGQPAVDTYRWLITKEDVLAVGDPGHVRTTAPGRANLANCLPVRNGAADTTAGLTPAVTYKPGSPGFDTTNLADYCPWPSIRNTAGDTHTVAQGDQSNVAAGTGLVTFADASHALPVGKYLVSVMASGFKIGGAHFQMPLADATPVTVELPYTPTPLGNIRIQVFNDRLPVDGTYEAGAEGPDPGVALLDTDPRRMKNFQGYISDVFGGVTTDWFGNTLCTHYEHDNSAPGNGPTPDFPDGSGPLVKDIDGKPVIDPTKPAACLTDNRNQILIPNLGPNRYGVTVSTPSGQVWSQTTNLEGGHDHDVWVMEGDTGFDTEMVVGGEPVPFVPFGFVKAMSLPVAQPGTTLNTIKGQVMEGLSYIGGSGGQVIPQEPGVGGGAFKGPIDRPWVALSDLGAGDAEVYAGRGGVDGTFSIGNVPDGTYSLTTWDEPQNFIIQNITISVRGGQVLDVGKQFLPGWFTHIEGTVFVDDNGNGKQDLPNETGIKDTVVTLRERDNTLMDQFANTAVTDDKGHYSLTQSYPLTKWLVLEHFNTRYEGTGVTVTASNDKTPTTYLGGGVDINVMNIIGLGGIVDWGVKPYAADTNGGIVGTVLYDTTRNELDPKYAAAESYSPGIPNVTVNLYASMHRPDGVQQLFAPDTTNATTGVVTTGLELPWVDPNTGLVLNPGDPGYADGVYDDPNGTGVPHKDLTHLLNTTVSESWSASTGCTAKDYKGDPLTDQLALPAFGDPNLACVEAPMMGFQARPSEVETTAGVNTAFGQTVNGNYGFADSNLNLYPITDTANNPNGLQMYAPLHCPAAPDPARMAGCVGTYDYENQVLPADDYAVQVVSPKDDKGAPVYQPTREEDVNVFDGDARAAQEDFAHGVITPETQTPPYACAGTVVDPCIVPPPANPPSQEAGIFPDCVGDLHQVVVTNAAFQDAGGSPFKGQQRPLCDVKMVNLRSQQSVAPLFMLYTPVPLPTHFWGLVINDLGLTYDKRSSSFGEAQGIANVPVGIYDFQGNLVDKVDTDFNGFYESIEPSTSTYNCPLPAGPCPGMYRFVGNDPGQAPNNANPNYNPRFRTIATNFQAWPGLFTVTDTAPTQVASVVLAPGSTTPVQPNCDIVTAPIAAGGGQPALPATPQIFTTNRVTFDGDADNDLTRRVTLTGINFGTTKGRVLLTPLEPTPNGTVRNPITLTGGEVPVWNNNTITFTVPRNSSNTLTPDSASLPRAGGYSVSVSAGPLATRVSTRSGVTVYSTSGAARGPATLRYNPTVFTVNKPTLANATEVANNATTVQGALDKALAYSAGAGASAQTPLVVVYPNAIDPRGFNPHRGYYENVIVQGRVRLQGIGTGGVNPGTTTWIPGSEINGIGFNADNTTVWYDKLASQPHGGLPEVADAATVTVVPPVDGDTAFRSSLFNRASIDGLSITGGHQLGVTTNVNAITGAVHTGIGTAGATITQGGGIYAHAFTHDMLVTNNVIAGNDGSYGGGIRVGTPYAPGTANNNRNANQDQRIAYNVIRDNGGMGLAGGIGLFNDSDNYQVDHNVLCGNFSAEYGGGLTVFGASPNGSIHDNDVYYNQSYDEGGGIMLAGELPSVATQASDGTGAASIYNNQLYYNNANDDGGAIRLLQAGNFPFEIYNNMIADNLSAHEGGGVALDDAPDVRFYNNTVVNNVTTATAVTSDGKAAPAGFSTGANSDALIAANPGLAAFTAPKMFDNIFWNNRAGTWNATKGTVDGVGINPTTTPLPANPDVKVWDMGVPDHTGTLTVYCSVYQVPDAIDGFNGLVATPPTGGVSGGCTNVTATAPAFVRNTIITVGVLPWRTNPAFRQALIVTQNLPLSRFNLNYHLAAGTNSAVNRGRAAVVIPTPAPSTTYRAPVFDFETQAFTAAGISLGVRYGAPVSPTPAQLALLAGVQIDAGADER
jgi:hypothetical protein